MMSSAVLMNEREGAPVQRSQRVAVSVVGLLLAAMLVVGVDWLARPDGFPVERVSFEGEFKRVDPAALKAAVGEAVKGNFFLLDLDAVEAAAKTVPWVDKVSVRRQWPRSIHIAYSEHQIMARWGAGAWLSTSARVVDAPGGEVSPGLPLLDGPAGTERLVAARYRELAGLLDRAALKLTGLQLTRRRAWIAEVVAPDAGAGLRLMIGRHDVRSRVARLVQVYPRALAPRAAEIEQVDLRYPNGFAVAWKTAGGSSADSIRESGR
jgi:cell division protein FtsQ